MQTTTCIRKHTKKQPGHALFLFRRDSEGAISHVLQSSSDDTTKALTSFLHVSGNLVVTFAKGSRLSTKSANGGISWRRFFLEGSTIFGGFAWREHQLAFTSLPCTRLFDSFRRRRSAVHFSKLGSAVPKFRIHPLHRVVWLNRDKHEQRISRAAKEGKGNGWGMTARAGYERGIGPQS